MYAYDALKTTLDQIQHLGFLFGEPIFVNRLNPKEAEPRGHLQELQS